MQNIDAIYNNICFALTFIMIIQPYELLLKNKHYKLEELVSISTSPE